PLQPPAAPRPRSVDRGTQPRRRRPWRIQRHRHSHRDRAQLLRERAMGFRRALIVALIAATPLARAAEDPARVVQERIKAAFLYKFASYVEWPREAFPQPESPIVIGVS